MRLKGLGAMVLTICVVAGLALTPAAFADAGGFACTQATDFVSPKYLLTSMQDTSSGAPTNLTALQSSVYGAGYNGIAFDRNDGYIYAIAHANVPQGAGQPGPTDLLRMDQLGNVTDLGPVQGLPADSGIQYVTGGFDSSGQLWVLAVSTGSTAYAVNVSGTPSVTRTLTLSSVFHGYDWAYDYGYMWGLDQGRLYQVDLTNGQVRVQDVRSLGDAALMQQFNAVWTFANGDLGFQGADATSNTLVRATVVPGPLGAASDVTALNEYTVPGASSPLNDGTSCQPPDQQITASPAIINAVEGNPFTGQVATFTDPDTSATASEYGASITWDDGTKTAGTVISTGTPGQFAVTGSHTWPEEGNNGPERVTIYDTDNSSNQAVVNSSAVIADAPLNAACATPSTSGQSFNGSTATFTDGDPGGLLSDYTASINWGDGSSNSSGTITGGPGSGPYTVAGGHAYTSTGIYTITTSISDVGGSHTSTSNCQVVVYAFAPGGGSFVIGNNNSATGTAVTFWGAQWWKLNSLTGGTAPAAFKGFALNPSNPACGVNWSTDPGNSAPPPSGPLPAYMGIIVSSSIGKSGAQISGDTQHIVVVATNAGYKNDPGHAGTGTVVAQVC